MPELRAVHGQHRALGGPSALKILLVHDFYQHSSGEDRVVWAEEQLLRGAGHDVITFYRQNSEIPGYNILQAAVLPARTIWGVNSHEALRALLRRERPTLAHFHNLLPLISPSAYYACQSEGVPVVQTLHNFRIICPSATLFRDGRPCEECPRTSSFAPAIVHGCYRASRPATIAVATMIKVHQAMGTWATQVDRYIALSEFARNKLVGFGLPPARITVKPNFLPTDPGEGNDRREYALFIGRLVPEKGVRSLLDAWARLSCPMPLRVVGDGPLCAEVQRAADRSNGKIEWLRQLPNESVLKLIKQARFLVFPSEWYEGFPVTLVESMACGTPVVGARIGSIPEIITNGVTGIHFSPGNVEDLASKVQWASSHPDKLLEMGAAARREFLAKYTAKRNYGAITEIYQSILDSRPEPAKSSMIGRRKIARPGMPESKPAVMLVHNFYQHRGGEDV